MIIITAIFSATLLLFVTAYMEAHLGDGGNVLGKAADELKMIATNILSSTRQLAGRALLSTHSMLSTVLTYMLSTVFAGIIVYVIFEICKRSIHIIFGR